MVLKVQLEQLFQLMLEVTLSIVTSHSPDRDQLGYVLLGISGNWGCSANGNVGEVLLNALKNLNLCRYLAETH